MCIAIVLIIANFALAIIAMEVRLRPPKTPRSVFWWRSAFYGSLVLSIICAIWQLYAQIKSDARKDAAFGMSLDHILTQVKESDRMQSDRIKLVATKQDSLSVDLMAIRAALITNESVGVELRGKILQSGRKFEELDSDVDDLTNVRVQLHQKITKTEQEAETSSERKRLDEAQEADDAWNKTYQVYDFAIRQLEEIMNRVAREQNDKAVSDNSSFPRWIDISVEATNLATVKLEKNTNWICTVWADPATTEGRRCLRIKCGTNSVWITPIISADMYDTYVLRGEETFKYSRNSGDQTRKPITDALEILVGLAY